MRKYRFLATRIFPYKNKGVDSVLIRENTGHWKAVFSHILCSDIFGELFTCQVKKPYYQSYSKIQKFWKLVWGNWWLIYLELESATGSDYKHQNTIKFLVSFFPNRISDKAIILHSCFQSFLFFLIFWSPTVLSIT